MRHLTSKLTRGLTVGMAEFYAYAAEMVDDMCEVCGEVPRFHGDEVAHFMQWPMDAGYVRMCPSCYTDTVNNFRPIPNPEEIDYDNDEDEVETVGAESTHTTAPDECIFEIGDLVDDYDGFEYPFAMDPANPSSSSSI